MKKAPKSEMQQVLVELRLIRNELRKANATLDDIHRIAIEEFPPHDPAADNGLL